MPGDEKSTGQSTFVTKAVFLVLQRLDQRKLTSALCELPHWEV